MAIEEDPDKPEYLPGDTYQLLDDDEHLVRSLPMLLCQKGRRGKGVPRHAMVRCERNREDGNWWILTFEKIDYNQSFTLVARMDPKHGFDGGDQDLFAHTSPRTIDDRGRPREKAPARDLGEPASGLWSVLAVKACTTASTTLEELAMSPDGRYLAALQNGSSGRYACLWQTDSGKLLQRLEAEPGMFFGGNRLFFGSKIFDLEKQAMAAEESRAPEFDSANKRAVIVGPTSVALMSNGEVAVFDWRSNVVKPPLAGEWTWMDRQFLATGELAETGSFRVDWAPLTNPAQRSSFVFSTGLGRAMLGMGGGRIAFYVADDEQTHIWSLPEGRKLESIPGLAHGLEISADGKTMATCEKIGRGGRQNARFRIVVWDVDTVRKVSQAEIKLKDPSQLRFDDAARTLAVCDQTGPCVIMKRRR